MFEKEAEEYREKEKDKGYYWVTQEMEQSELDTIVDESFKDGAEFGYNKANEWHYPSKGEYPKDNSFVLVWTENGGITTNYGKEYSDGIPENGLFEGIHISDVIAWKEIVLPELKESK